MNDPTDPSHQASPPLSPEQLQQMALHIKHWAATLGFQECAITSTDISAERAALETWIESDMHAEMRWFEHNHEKRLDPKQLVPGTQRVISVRMDYLPPEVETLSILQQPQKAYIARYTLGRDYHKLLRSRLKQLGALIEAHFNVPISTRPFVDSAPVLERPLARNAGLGWIGKHTLLLNRHAGSWFVLGELFINQPLPVDAPYTQSHCGRCSACMDICPTQAFPAPYVLDARRCISYLTIEHKGAIPVPLRPLMGNRIFGCDDCQLVCPWNRFAHFSDEDDFKPRHQLDDCTLLELFLWDEETFLRNTQGSAIRRTGFEGWQRNIAIALGNSDGGDAILQALQRALQASTSSLLAEHFHWAIQQLTTQKNVPDKNAAPR